MLAQQERIERRRAVYQPQDLEIALDVATLAIVADIAQHVFEAALSDEKRPAAGAQVRLLERNDDLGRNRAPRRQGIKFVCAQAVPENDCAVDGGRLKERGA